MKYKIELSRDELLAFDKFCSFFPKTELEERCPQILKDRNFLTFLGKLYKHINGIRGVSPEENERLKKQAQKFLGLR